jgi:hypothetical protein
VLGSIDLQPMNLFVKGSEDVPGAAREINQNATGIDHIDPESVRLKPMRDYAKVLLG